MVIGMSRKGGQDVSNVIDYQRLQLERISTSKTVNKELMCGAVLHNADAMMDYRFLFASQHKDSRIIYVSHAANQSDIDFLTFLSPLHKLHVLKASVKENDEINILFQFYEENLAGQTPIEKYKALNRFVCERYPGSKLTELFERSITVYPVEFHEDLSDWSSED